MRALSEGSRRALTKSSLHDNLMERILARANLQRAWKRVKANKGATRYRRNERRSVPGLRTKELALDPPSPA